MVFSRERDAALQECVTLARDAAEQVRRGVGELADILVGIDPVLRPGP